MVRGGAEWKALFAGCGVNAQWTVNCSRQRREFQSSGHILQKGRQPLRPSPDHRLRP